jgi:periplasmic protein TonB
MPVYAPVHPYADRRRHPRALLLIISAHALVLAAVMTAKTEIGRQVFKPTTITLIPDKQPPPENVPPQPREDQSAINRPVTIIPIPQPNPDVLDPTPLPLPDPGPFITTRPDTVPTPVEPVRVGPRFVTPESELKPPYPQQKLRMGEEAVLRLKLSIDERGRVTAVDPVGSADPVFLAAARRHLIAHWRYRPATEDGRAVASSTVIMLRFQLDD